MQSTVTEQISLDPSMNRTGDVWHIFLKGDFRDMLYGYKFEGKFSPEEGHRHDATKILVDPYAKVSFIKYFLFCIFFGLGDLYFFYTLVLFVTNMQSVHQFCSFC